MLDKLEEMLKDDKVESQAKFETHGIFSSDSIIKTLLNGPIEVGTKSSVSVKIPNNGSVKIIEDGYNMTAMDRKALDDVDSAIKCREFVNPSYHVNMHELVARDWATKMEQYNMQRMLEARYSPAPAPLIVENSYLDTTGVAVVKRDNSIEEEIKELKAAITALESIASEQKNAIALLETKLSNVGAEKDISSTTVTNTKQTIEYSGDPTPLLAGKNSLNDVQPYKANFTFSMGATSMGTTVPTNAMWYDIETGEFHRMENTDNFDDAMELVK